MSGSATFELTEQDHVDAVHTHTGRIAGKLAWMLLFVALLFPLIDLWAGTPILKDRAFWFFLALAILFLGWDWIARDWSIRRAHRQGKAMHGPIRLSWDGERIIFDTDMSHAEYRWDRFYRWMASKKSLLLYRDSQMFFPLPVRALPDGAADDMIAALKEAGVREKGGPQSAQSSPMSS